MERYQEEFIDFMVESDVLKFGDFTLKSGRKSPALMPRTAAERLRKRSLYEQPFPNGPMLSCEKESRRGRIGLKDYEHD